MVGRRELEDAVATGERASLIDVVLLVHIPIWRGQRNNVPGFYGFSGVRVIDDRVMMSQSDTPAVMFCCGSICRVICRNLSDMVVRRASQESTGKGRCGMRTNFEVKCEGGAVTRDNLILWGPSPSGGCWQDRQRAVGTIRGKLKPNNALVSGV